MTYVLFIFSFAGTDASPTAAPAPAVDFSEITERMDRLELKLTERIDILEQKQTERMDRLGQSQMVLIDGITELLKMMREEQDITRSPASPTGIDDTTLALVPEGEQGAFVENKRPRNR